MLIDAAEISPDSCLEADVAVVGAGPAGIVVALELARAGRRVLLIDSGGDSRRPETQRLGELVGEDPAHVSMSLATSRQVGGASNLWGGRCVPFDPIDFEPRAIVGEPTWPVSYEELEPYFQRACGWCVCGEAVFDAHDVPGLAERSLVPGFPDGMVRASALERWSLPTNFGREYRSDLENTPGLTLVTNLTCTEVVCDPERARVEHLRAQSLDGRSVRISASRYVLACGGLEVTRLLFASDRNHPGGLGNHSGHLGRWYMAHVESRIARVHFTTPPAETIYGHERDPAGVYVRRRLTFSEDCQRSERLPNIAMWLVNPDIGDAEHGSGILSFVYLMLISPLGRFFVAEGIRQAHVKTAQPVSKRRHLANVLRDLPSAVRFALEFGYRRFLKRGRKVPGFFVPSAANIYPLLYHGEHLPHRDSYAEPTPECDALGMPRLRTHLWFGQEDVAGVIRAHRCVDAYLREHGLGHLEYLHEDSESAIREQLFGGYHQAGTTRMSTLPQDGVVDRDLAVHGFDDLYVASSSTFVTSSQANSTFMIVVFALRLADHLRQELDASPDIQREPSPVEHRGTIARHRPIGSSL
jgi:choline dehydrogenase-like flavoprotein